jgi:hypothetical protein
MANAQLEIISGSSSTTITANALGVATFTGTVGAWALTLTSGVTYPTAGTPATPTLDIGSVVGAGSAPLEILFSDDGYTQQGVADYVVHLNGAVNISSVVSTLYATAGSHLLDTTGTQIFSTSTANGTASGLISVGSPYSLTEEVLITPGRGAGSFLSFDGTVTVPDGGIALTSLGSAFVLLAGVSRKFRK